MQPCHSLEPRAGHALSQRTGDWGGSGCMHSKGGSRAASKGQNYCKDVSTCQGASSSSGGWMVPRGLKHAEHCCTRTCMGIAGHCTRMLGIRGLKWPTGGAIPLRWFTSQPAIGAGAGAPLCNTMQAPKCARHSKYFMKKSASVPGWDACLHAATWGYVGPAQLVQRPMAQHGLHHIHFQGLRGYTR